MSDGHGGVAQHPGGSLAREPTPPKGRAPRRRGWAGAPDHASSAGTSPKTAEPGAISAPAPIDAPGSKRAASTDPGALRRPRSRPTWSTSPSIQCPLEVDLGLDGAPGAEGEHAR